MVLFEIITREKPPKRNWKELFGFNVKAHEALIPKDTPPEMLDLLCRCTEYEAQDRPTFEVQKRKSHTNKRH